MSYITALSCISHYNTVDENYFFQDLTVLSESNRLAATEPVYKEYIPAMLIRRMSHIVKMGATAGLISMKKAGIEKPDAIITGTGIGCYDDTDKFLRTMLDNNEQLLTPTSFIQSTHNTVAGTLALLCQCNGYNFTYVHQNHSFEYALLDALMQLNDKEAETIVVGGVDEINDSVFELFNRAGYIKKEGQTNKGYALGEGAAFFTLSASATPESLAKINGVKCLQHIATENDLITEAQSFLKNLGLTLNDVNLVLSGNCGDEQSDKKINAFNVASQKPVAHFKRLCGEYFTASSFALWLAALILKNQAVPAVLLANTEVPQTLKNILIVNHYQDKLYSFISVSAC